MIILFVCNATQLLGVTVYHVLANFAMPVHIIEPYCFNASTL